MRSTWSGFKPSVGSRFPLFERRLRFDDFVLIIVILWLSRAWIYIGDAQTQEQIDAPLLSFFQLFTQFVCLGIFITRVRVKLFWQYLKGDFWLLVFLVFSFCVLPFSSVLWNSTGMLRAFCLLLIVSYYIRKRVSGGEVISCYANICALVISLSVAAALFFSFGRAEGEHLGSWRGLYSHKNGLGEAAAFSTIFFGALCLTGSRSFIRYALFFLLSVTCLLMSGSATSLGASCIVLALLVLFKKISYFRFGARFRSYLAFSVLLLVVLVVVLALEVAVDFLGRDLTFTGRTFIWDQYIDIGSERAYQGWGWTASSTNDEIVDSVREVVRLPYLRTTHSVYVQMYVEFGFFGFFAYLIWILWTVSKAFMSYAETGEQVFAIRASVALGMLIVGLFESIVGFMPCLWLGFLLMTNPSMGRVTCRR